MNFKNKSISLTAFFYACILVLIQWDHADFLLKQISEFLPSSATASNFDINGRILFYFKAIGLISIFTLIVSWILNHVFTLFKPQRGLLISMEMTSMAGLLLLLGRLFGNAGYSHSLTLVFIIHTILVITFVYSILYENSLLLNAKKILIAVFSLSFSITWFVFQSAVFFELEWFQHFFRIYFFVALLILFVIRKQSTTQINKFLNASAPLLFFPLLNILVIEFSYVMMRHEKFFDANYLWWTFFAIALSYSIHKWRKSEGSSLSKQKVNKLFLFSVVINIAITAFYHPLAEITNEQFEFANPAIAVMNTFHFDMWPYFDYFNTHLISEIIFPFLYACLNNGVTAQEFSIYDFLNYTLWISVAYFFTLHFTRNAFIAIAVTVLLPLFLVLFPFYIVLLLPLGLQYTIKKQTWFSYFVLVFAIVLNACWQLDSGSSIVAALLVFILLNIIFRLVDINWRKFATAFISTCFLCFGIAIALAVMHKVDLIYNFRLIFSYLNSAQSYGFKSISHVEVSAVQFQYLFFPLVGLLLLIFVLLNKDKFSIKRILRPEIISLLLLILFSLINYQRGITRHSFAEYWDKHVSSFMFLVLPAGVIYLYKKRFNTSQAVLFLTFVLLLIFGFKYPAYHLGNNFFKASFNKFIETKNLLPHFSKKVDRYTETKENEITYSGLKIFMDKNFSPQSTFLDFSNSPMLYVNLQRKNPNYFNQPLLCSHNKYLQTEAIKKLSQFDVPVCVFSNCNFTFWDQIDGIPNAVRHSFLSSFIFENYSPYASLNNMDIWLRNDLIFKPAFANSGLPASCAMNFRSYDSKLIPKIQWEYFVKKGTSSKIIQPLLFNSTEIQTEITAAIDSLVQRKNQYLHLVINCALTDTESIAVVFSFNDELKSEILFSILPETASPLHNVLISLSDQYPWFKGQCDKIILKRKSTDKGTILLEKSELINWEDK